MNEVLKQIKKDLSRFDNDKETVEAYLIIFKKLFKDPDSLTPLELFDLGSSCDYLRRMAPVNYMLGYSSHIRKQVLKITKVIKPNEQETSKGTQS